MPEKKKYDGEAWQEYLKEIEDYARRIKEFIRLSGHSDVNANSDTEDSENPTVPRPPGPPPS